MKQPHSISVTSHVGRDLLQSAAIFKNEDAVIWEYVVNSIQYVDRGTTPKIQVIVHPRKKEIEIHDNGAGMTADDLEHFFKMHAENIERKRGRPGRGKFGTGKSAAFGIASELVVDTRRNGLRNRVRLTREAIDSSDGSEVPLEWDIRNEVTDEPNGTTVQISRIALDRLEVPRVIDYVERHLQSFRRLKPEVAINDHACTYRELSISEEYRFDPSSDQARILGPCQLLVQVSQTPLAQDDRGVFITAGEGNLIARESGGIDSKDFGAYLTGTIDIPSLDSDTDTIQAFDQTRSLRLNPRHPPAAVLLGFIGSKLEHVRKKLVEQEREARKSEESRRLADEADRIADILNRDFDEVKRRLQEIRSASMSKGAVETKFGGTAASSDSDDAWIKGLTEPGDVEQTGGGRSTGGGVGRKPPNVATAGSPSETGQHTVSPAGGTGRGRKRPAGGFKVRYKPLGKDQDRSRYDESSLTILINLDHPVVVAAQTRFGLEDPAFKRLSYEIAFSEYAMALGYEMTKDDPDMPADDLLYEVRSCLNRVAGAAVTLYRE